MNFLCCNPTTVVTFHGEAMLSLAFKLLYKNQTPVADNPKKIKKIIIKSILNINMADILLKRWKIGDTLVELISKGPPLQSPEDAIYYMAGNLGGVPKRAFKPFKKISIVIETKKPTANVFAELMAMSSAGFVRPIEILSGKNIIHSYDARQLRAGTIIHELNHILRTHWAPLARAARLRASRKFRRAVFKRFPTVDETLRRARVLLFQLMDSVISEGLARYAQHMFIEGETTFPKNLYNDLHAELTKQMHTIETKFQAGDTDAIRYAVYLLEGSFKYDIGMVVIHTILSALPDQTVETLTSEFQKLMKAKTYEVYYRYVAACQKMGMSPLIGVYTRIGEKTVGIINYNKILNLWHKMLIQKS
jgi:hypothetical protein